MASYTTNAKIRQRLTEAGVQFVCDRDGDDSLSPDEIEACIDRAREYADGIIDEHVCGFVPVGIARGSGNAWLDDRAVDIAAFRASTDGGQDAPDAFLAAFEDAKERLERVQGTALVPGLVIPFPTEGPGRSVIGPRVANIRGGHRGRHH